MSFDICMFVATASESVQLVLNKSTKWWCIEFNKPRTKAFVTGPFVSDVSSHCKHHLGIDTKDASFIGVNGSEDAIREHFDNKVNLEFRTTTQVKNFMHHYNLPTKLIWRHK